MGWGLGLILPFLTGLVAAEEPALRLNNNEMDEAVIFAFDDHAVPFTGNLQLSMERARKHRDNPVLPIGGQRDSG